MIGHALFGERGDAAPEGAARQRIGTAGGLIEKQNLRLVQQRGRHGEALFVAAGQLRAGSARVLRQLELLHRPADARASALAAQTIGAGEELEVLHDAQRPVERELLRDISQARAGRGGRMAHVGARHMQLTAARRQQPAQHAEGGGLARAVGSEQPEDLAAAHLEVDRGRLR